MHTLALLLLLASPPRPVHTFSIVARDPQTGDIGVAVQSHWFAVGQIVPWAEAGVGAVATQSFVDPSYGQLGLDLLRNGKSAPDALRGLLSSDAACDVRQVAILDASGNAGTFTGGRDIQAAGGVAGNGTASELHCGTSGGTLTVGRDFAAQANLMSNANVWPAMAYTATTGDLADRLLAMVETSPPPPDSNGGSDNHALFATSSNKSGAFV